MYMCCVYIIPTCTCTCTNETNDVHYVCCVTCVTLYLHVYVHVPLKLMMYSTLRVLYNLCYIIPTCTCTNETNDVQYITCVV